MIVSLCKMIPVIPLFLMPNLPATDKQIFEKNTTHINSTLKKMADPVTEAPKAAPATEAPKVNTGV